jgi:myo-inositol catabolism protein IolC
MIDTIHALQDAGVEPDVWKIEGLDRRDECERIVAAARRNGRTAVGCIVLGRGSDEQAVVRWLTVAAGVQGFIGFAVGRTTWLDAVIKWRAHAISRETAMAQIARRFREWAAIFGHRVRQ